MATVLQGTRFLNSVRFKTIVETLASRLARTRPLTFIDRLTEVPATDDEIVGRFTGTVIAADLIADDQEAVVQESGSVELASTAIPNLKIGQRVGQAKLNLMNRLQEIGGRAQEEDALEMWENQLAENLVYGVRQRMNALACAMMLDSFSYNRLGIVISGASWGTPSALKVTPSNYWTDTTNGDPIGDINSIRNTARETYGIDYNRITLSSTALRYMAATTKFANVASLTLNSGFLLTSPALPVTDTPRMANIIGQVLDMQVVIDDGSYTERTNEGMKVTRRYLPSNKVILDNTQWDNDSRIWDWANGVVTESIVDSLVNGSGSLGGGEFGPLGYWTGRQDLNPPDVVAWAVARGFPRKHVPEASGVLTIAAS